MAYTPKDMMFSIRGGDAKAVETILSTSPELLNLETPLGSWLHIAVDKNQKQIVELLLGAGLDINVRGGPSKNTALNVAAYCGHSGMVDFLLSKGAILDVSEPDRNPLFAAIHGGHQGIVQILLNAGIDASIKYSGSTMKNMGAVDFAREWGRNEIAELIQQYEMK
ncbi:ankyrin repeat domain-containing protein [Acidovorax facilis]|uniref:ankyrin repeat domain-containing protein n=1 Tax=Acidovorax facilis TaxID=12917 RepID=UPI003CE8C1CD